MKKLVLFFTIVLGFNLYSQDNNDYKVGMRIMPKDYSNVKKGLYENMSAIQINDKWGVIDQNYVLTTPIIYEGVYFFVNGICKVKYEGKIGYIDKSGNFIIQTKYDDIWDFNNPKNTNNNRTHGDFNITIYVIKDKYGFIDINGKEITQPIFSMSNGMSVFIKGVASVMKDNKWGLIDKSGNFIVPCIYKSCKNYFRNGFNAIAFTDEKGMCGFYNKDGKIIVPFQNKQIADDWELGIKSTADEVPPVFKVKGKFELVKNVERFSDFEWSLDENTINNKSFLSDYYNKKRRDETILADQRRIEEKKVSASNNQTINQNLKNEDCSVIINEYEAFVNEFSKYCSAVKSGKRIPNMSEYSNWDKKMRFMNDIIYNCSKGTNINRVLTSMLKLQSSAQIIFGSNPQSSNSNSTVSNNSNNKCHYCKPSDSKGWYIRDYDDYKKINTNGRYIKNIGHRPCSSCHGTGDCRAHNTCSSIFNKESNVCLQCKGDRWKECDRCKGTGESK